MACTRLLKFQLTKTHMDNFTAFCTRLNMRVILVLQVLSVPSQPTGLQLHYSEPVTGLRLYPQSWSNKKPTIPHPLFIACNPFRQKLEYTT